MGSSSIMFRMCSRCSINLQWIPGAQLHPAHKSISPYTETLLDASHIGCFLHSDTPYYLFIHSLLLEVTCACVHPGFAKLKVKGIIWWLRVTFSLGRWRTIFSNNKKNLRCTFCASFCETSEWAGCHGGRALCCWSQSGNNPGDYNYCWPK